MRWPRTASLYVLVSACFGVSACGPQEQPTSSSEIVVDDLDRPDSLDIYVDTTGPNGFFAQVEHQAFYTSREAYEAAAPALYAQAAQAGLPVRIVLGPKMREELTTQAYTWGFRVSSFYVTVSLPEKAKPLGGCINQDAYYSNLRIHYIDPQGRGVELRDYHLAAYRRLGDRSLCLAIYESETRWSACTCPGARFEDLSASVRANVLQGLRDSGMSQSMANIMAAATVPILLATLILA